MPTHFFADANFVPIGANVIDDAGYDAKQSEGIFVVSLDIVSRSVVAAHIESDNLSEPIGCEDNEDKERVLARVRRRRGRGAYADDDVYDDVDDDGRRRSRREDESVNYAADMLEDEGIFDEMDDEYYDDDDIENDESYDTFSNTVIPNQLLDSIDPDGSAERFSELASDPRFWFDIFLFITVLDFISFIGPRNPFLDLVPEMYTAGLPPPGI
eukprot:jgi/Psemu1/12469/gm1.12469_g